jgi:Ca2+-binding RTX toxin-like protein
VTGIGQDQIYGYKETGDKLFFSGTGSDQLRGGEGHDTLVAGDAAASLSGSIPSPNDDCYAPLGASFQSRCIPHYEVPSAICVAKQVLGGPMQDWHDDGTALLHDDGVALHDRVASINIFKHIAGVFTMVADSSTGTGSPDLRVRLIRQSSGEVVQEGMTDEDGFYALFFKHKGKPAWYEVVPSGDMTRARSKSRRWR